MRNIQKHQIKSDNDALVALLAKAKDEERKDRALMASVRLDKLAAHIASNELTGIEATELLRQEAARYEHESQEFH